MAEAPFRGGPSDPAVPAVLRLACWLAACVAAVSARGVPWARGRAALRCARGLLAPGLVGGLSLGGFPLVPGGVPISRWTPISPPSPLRLPHSGPGSHALGVLSMDGDYPGGDRGDPRGWGRKE